MSFPLKPVAEQTVVLTGASSGIGLATTRALADEGATLVLVSRNQAALDALAEECRAKGARALAVRADVGRNEDLERVAQRTIETFGGSTPGSTTPAWRSTARANRSRWRISAGCSTPIFGAWCTGP
jgi:NAD(P)-dependent dehydrogenase (short-subunit alcohol dehydrogenase family)